MSLLQLSICASEPQKADYFLRLLWVLLQYSFLPFPNCWITICAKDDGTAIEVFPTTHVLEAGPDQISCQIKERDAAPTFVHAAVVHS